jgi:hypothetical protein
MESLNSPFREVPQCGGVYVYVNGVEKSAWELLKRRFTFLDTRKSDEFVPTYSGKLLLSPQDKGKIFVKGVFVSYDKELTYGYDLKNGALDRDRKMVEHYDLIGGLRGIWEKAVATRPDLFDKVLDLLDLDAKDMSGISSYGNNAQIIVDRCYAQFVERHGKDAFPVANTAECADIEHFGKKGIVCPRAQLAILQQKMGKFCDIRGRLEKETVKVYSFCDLSPSQRKVMDDAIDLAGVGYPGTDVRALVDVVEFRSMDLQGLWNNGRASVALKCLDTLPNCLRVIVHEIGHQFGSDGDKSHIATIEKANQNIIAFLWK